MVATAVVGHLIYIIYFFCLIFFLFQFLFFLFRFRFRFLGFNIFATAKILKTGNGAFRSPFRSTILPKQYSITSALHMILLTVLTNRINPQQVNETDQSSLVIVNPEDIII